MSPPSKNLGHVILRTSIASLGSRVVTALLGLLSIPLVYKGLGSEQFAEYSFVVALGSVTVFIDQGLAVQLRTDLASNSNSSVQRAKIITTGLIFLFRVSFAVGFLGFLFLAVAPWGALLTFSSPSFNWLCAIFFLSNTICLALSGVIRGLEGLGKYTMVASLPILSSLWMLITAFAGYCFHLPIIFYLLASSTNLVPAALVGWKYLKVKIPDRSKFRTDPTRIPLNSVWPLATIASLSAMTSNLGLFVTSFLFPAKLVGEYAATSKLTAFLIIAISAASPILWTYFIRSRSSGKSAPARDTIIVSLTLTTMAVLGCIGITIFGAFIMNIWLNLRSDNIQNILLSLVLPIPILAAQLVPGNAQNDYLGLKFQAVFLALSFAASLLFSYLLGSSFGIFGVGAGIALGQFCLFLVPLWVRWLAHR